MKWLLNDFVLPAGGSDIAKKTNGDRSNAGQEQSNLFNLDVYAGSVGFTNGFAVARDKVEFLSSLPRGNGHLGFHQDAAPTLLIKSVRIASDLREEEPTHLEVLRMDAPLFLKLIEARRNRQQAWFHTAAGAIDIGNVPLPVRLLT